MGFVLIKGTFTPGKGIPDGDTTRFVPNNANLLSRLAGRKAKVNAAGSVALRLEGIDAIEKAAVKPASTMATDALLVALGSSAAQRQDAPGWILARTTETNGRVVAFAYAGTTNRADGADVFLDGALLQKSVNFSQIQNGWAYPLYYNTLFGDLRQVLADGVVAARLAKVGYWPADATQTSVTVTGKAALAVIPPIWPKLWRRLDTYYKQQPAPNDLSGFLSYLKKSTERVDILTPPVTQKSIDDIVEVKGNAVRLLVDPNDVRVVSAV